MQLLGVSGEGLQLDSSNLNVTQPLISHEKPIQKNATHPENGEQQFLLLQFPCAALIATHPSNASKPAAKRLQWCLNDVVATAQNGVKVAPNQPTSSEPLERGAALGFQWK